MKKIVLILTICSLGFIAKAQDASVEKSVYGVQTGLLGVWFHNEVKVTNNIAIRGEFGFDAGIFGGGFYEKTGFLMIPVITVEPRLYYNLSKRLSKSKNIAGNSGNFISLKTSFHPDWFVISNYEGLRIVNQVSVIPTWGIRRNIGSHFNYETGFGIGYEYIFAKSAGYSTDQSGVAVNLLFKIGYKF